METAYIRVRIRPNLHMQVYFDFILYIISLGTVFWTSVSLLLEHTVEVSPSAWLDLFGTEPLDLHCARPGCALDNQQHVPGRTGAERNRASSSSFWRHFLGIR